MKISIVCSSRLHPIFTKLEEWCEQNKQQNDITLVERVDQLDGGDVLFLISCSELVNAKVRSLFRSTLVLHASNLPEGRGWSPHIWEIINGRNLITVSLIEAEDKVDTGAIWAQKIFKLEGHELFSEINQRLFDTEIELMDYAVANFDQITPRGQSEDVGSYYERRSPADSEIDPSKSLLESFNLLRVADSDRFPAFFYHLGQKYIIRLEKASKND